MAYHSMVMDGRASGRPRERAAASERRSGQQPDEVAEDAVDDQQEERGDQDEHEGRLGRLDHLVAGGPRDAGELGARVPKVVRQPLEHGLDLDLAVTRVLPVPRAVLAEFELGGRVAPVLVGGVVAALALGAFEQQLDANVTGHGGLPKQRAYQMPGVAVGTEATRRRWTRSGGAPPDGPTAGEGVPRAPPAPPGPPPPRG